MRHQVYALSIWMLAGFLAAVVAFMNQAGFLINTTPSMPMGLWRVKPVMAPFWRNQAISICPNNSALFKLARTRGYIPAGNCPGRYESMLKTVAAIPGDTVTISNLGIQVNGKMLVNSTSKAFDAAGRYLPRLNPGRYQVALGTLRLISSHNPNSFDSRYFGPLPTKNIRGVADPVWVAGKP